MAEIVSRDGTLFMFVPCDGVSVRITKMMSIGSIVWRPHVLNRMRCILRRCFLGVFLYFMQK